MTEDESKNLTSAPVSLILGTAGHIDHGKTELVGALTGIQTDRLKEEQERGISIDLGFAYLDLPNGQRIGIVDVPGHERFIKTMVAGASGIDVVVFVIAADEGAMPQSIEHLDVCRFLGVKSGILVLTKVDLVDEEELALAQDDASDFVRGTFLSNAPVVMTSSKTGQGVEALRKEIERAVEAMPGRTTAGLFRMPIDRAFTMRGFGTVVTGTVISGERSVGSPVEVYPGKIVSKIRKIETHNVQVDQALAGHRTAINLPRVTKGDIRRGDVLSEPGKLNPSNVFDLHLMLNNSPRSELKSGARVRFHVGTKEALGRMYPIGGGSLVPGFDAFAQIRLEELVAALPNDRFVLRNYSPAQVIGGGSILSSSNRLRFRLGKELVRQLELLRDGSNMDRLAVLVQSVFPDLPDLDHVSIQLGVNAETTRDLVDKLCAQGILLQLSGMPERFLHSSNALDLADRVRDQLTRYHELYPLRTGMQRRALLGRLKQPIFEEILGDILDWMITKKKIASEGTIVRLASHEASLGGDQGIMAKMVTARLEKAGTSPVDMTAIATEVKTKFSDADEKQLREVINYLVQSGAVIRVSTQLLITTEGLKRATKSIIKHLSKNRTMTIADCRDLLTSSRRFVVPLLEFLDGVGITRREGDVRLRGSKGLESIR
ncbi:selenocysteine-specific translation elongation factor [bacterium]|nr:selenocysteine-specific translation elongation factor [bacterium]